METQPKIVVLCGGKFAFPSLQALGFEKYLNGVAIASDSKIICDSLEKECDQNNLNFKKLHSKNEVDDLLNWFLEINPDYIFSISFPYLITEKVLAYGEKKFINFHPAKLPEFRGSMPIFETLKYQETETAVAVHYMDKCFDSGEIIFQDKVIINPNETYGSLAVKLSKQTANSAINLANMLAFATKIPSVKQNEEEANFYEKPSNFDTFIKWKQMSAQEIEALVNACNPWNIGADTVYMGNQVKLIKITSNNLPHNAIPGTILKINEDATFNIACAENDQITVKLLKVDEGIIEAEDFIKTKEITNTTFL